MTVLVSKINFKWFLPAILLAFVTFFFPTILIHSTNKALFFAIILVLFLLLIIKPKEVFWLILGSLILFYLPFNKAHLFSIGQAKVYPNDMIMASLWGFVVVKLFFYKPTHILSQTSTKYFLAFCFWGILAVIRGIPRYGFSALGEARWYIVPLGFYFIVLIILFRRKDVDFFANWMAAAVGIMICYQFIEFYLLGGNDGLTGRNLFRFLNSIEALLVSFLFVSLFSFLINGEIKRNKFLVYLILAVLFTILIIAQVRSVWLATGGGLITVFMIYRRIIWRSSAVVIHCLVFLLLLVPNLNYLIEENFSRSMEASTLFLQNAESDATGHWRLIGWEQQLQSSMKNPFLGDGTGGYSLWYDGNSWQRVAVHNGFIMFFSKFGLIGLILFLIGLGYWYFEINKHLQTEKEKRYKLMSRIIQISIFMHLIYAFFYDFTPFFWILLAVGTILTRKGGSPNNFENNKSLIKMETI